MKSPRSRPAITLANRRGSLLSWCNWHSGDSECDKMALVMVYVPGVCYVGMCYRHAEAARLAFTRAAHRAWNAARKR